MAPVTSPDMPATGLGWPVSRETEPVNVSRETPTTGLGWPVSRETHPAPIEGSPS